MRDAFTPAAETIDKVRLSFLQWLAAQDQERHSWYSHYREYYDGDHDTQLTARMRKFLQIKQGEEFNTNACPIVVDALAERLNVTGFSGDDAQAEVFAEWWAANRMDAQQGIVHTAAVRDGDAYVLVEWSEELKRPLFSYELAFDGAEGIECHYEDERNKVAFASKRWRVKTGSGTGKQRRLNLYYPDRIEKYYSDADEFEGNWQPYQEPGQPWPIPWTGKDGKPLGVPVVHFKNNDEGYNYGQSELKNVVPLQNLLNKAVIDAAATADVAGFPIYTMLGDDPGILNVAPGEWVFSTRPPGGENGAAFGVLPGADMTPLIAYKDSIFVDIARISRTPLSYFQVSGQTPAEGTQKQQESGLLSKVTNRQTPFGNSWEDTMKLARRLANTFGSAGMNEDADVITQWKDARTRDDLEMVNVAKGKRELGVPEETLWAELGYDQTQIEAMKEQKRAEQQEQKRLFAQAMLDSERRFNAGDGGDDGEMQGQARQGRQAGEMMRNA